MVKNAGEINGFYFQAILVTEQLTWVLSEKWHSLLPPDLVSPAHGSQICYSEITKPKGSH